MDRNTVTARPTCTRPEVASGVPTSRDIKVASSSSRGFQPVSESPHAAARSAGAVADQDGNARTRSPVAASTSASPAAGTTPIGCPVAAS